MGKVNRSIILHYHIFKNAGTTIDWILKKNFGNEAMELVNPDHDAIINMRILQYYFQLHQNVKSLSSHQFRFPIPEISDLHFIPMIFIRHPIDRIYSVYNHFRRWEENHVFYKKAKDLNFREFVEWYFKSDDYAISNNATMKNAQTVFLSNLKDLSQISLQYLDLAIKNMKSCEVFGVVERINESLALAETTLRNHFNNIDLSYMSQNMNPDRLDNFEKRIALSKSELGDELFGRLIENNKLDLQLYEEANMELDKRIKLSQDFESKLSEFLKRCIKLQTNSS